VKFAWIHAEKAWQPVTALCKALQVSPSGYYAWRGRGPSNRQLEDARLSVEIAAVFKKSRGTYGSPRIHAELREGGVDGQTRRIGRKRVERLMKASSLTARLPKRFRRTTDSSHNLPVAENTLDRSFTAEFPDRAWVSDISYVWTAEGWLYLAVVIDVFSRRVVGWAADGHMRTGLALDALARALGHRQPGDGSLHHSDRGSQYAARDYQKALEQAGLTCSMSRKGNCWDNAVAESFFGTLKNELIHRHRWMSRAEARWAIGDYIDGWYNPHRKHSQNGYLSPVDFERRHRQEAWSAA